MRLVGSRGWAGGALAVCGLSAASILLTIPHTIEDFVYGVPERFGLALLPAAFIAAFVYAAQLLAALAAARGSRAGFVANAGLALTWLLAAALDHTHEILFVEPYRQGVASKALEAGVIGISALWLVASLAAARRPPVR